MNGTGDIGRRDVLRAAACAGVGLSFDDLLGGPGARQATPAGAAILGPRELLCGLDGLSRVAEPGNDPFADGHGAAAVIASVFYARENGLDPAAEEAILALVETRLLPGRIYAPQPVESPAPELIDGLAEDLDLGIDSLRARGHSMIFAALALKALRELPEAATPARIAGLRATVQSFGRESHSAPGVEAVGSFTELADPAALAGFIRFAFEEYLRALDLYLRGQGRHGFAGHALTVAHALVELAGMGYRESAAKGLRAYGQFVHEARQGADLDGRPLPQAPAGSPSPLESEYWTQQARRPADLFTTSHLIKYPYSFYALLAKLPDDDWKRRMLRTTYHLTAVS